jgi:hypothetical protein
MTLEAIHRQTKISKTTVYRVLKTFVHRGYLSQSPDGLYRQVTRPKKLCFGFGGLSGDLPFSIEVTESLKAAASSVGVDLMVLDNCYDAATAMRNAEEFVKRRVDLVIEFPRPDCRSVQLRGAQDGHPADPRKPVERRIPASQMGNNCRIGLPCGMMNGANQGKATGVKGHGCDQWTQVSRRQVG